MKLKNNVKTLRNFRNGILSILLFSHIGQVHGTTFSLTPIPNAKYYSIAGSFSLSLPGAKPFQVKGNTLQVAVNHHPVFIYIADDAAGTGGLTNNSFNSVINPNNINNNLGGGTLNPGSFQSTPGNNNSNPGSSPVAPVPEPSTYMMLISGLGALFAGSKRPFSRSSLQNS